MVGWSELALENGALYTAGIGTALHSSAQQCTVSAQQCTALRSNRSYYCIRRKENTNDNKSEKGTAVQQKESQCIELVS